VYVTWGCIPIWEDLSEDGCLCSLSLPLSYFVTATPDPYSWLSWGCPNQPYLTEYIEYVVLETGTPPKIFDLLFTSKD